MRKLLIAGCCFCHADLDVVQLRGFVKGSITHQPNQRSGSGVKLLPRMWRILHIRRSHPTPPVLDLPSPRPLAGRTSQEALVECYRCPEMRARLDA